MCRKSLAILLLLAVGRATEAGESTPAVVGNYRAPVSLTITAALEIRADGSAKYAITWFSIDGTEVPQRYVEEGRWMLQGATLTLTLPLETGQSTVVYEVTTCARRDIRIRPIRPCAQWLLPIRSDLPTGYTLAVMKSDAPPDAPPDLAYSWSIGATTSTTTLPRS